MKKTFIVIGLCSLALAMFLLFVPLGKTILEDAFSYTLVNGQSVRKYSNFTQMAGAATGIILSIFASIFGIYLIKVAIEVYKEEKI